MTWKVKLNDRWGPHSEYGVLSGAVLRAAVAKLVAGTIQEEIRCQLASRRIVRKYFPNISKEGGPCQCSHS